MKNYTKLIISLLFASMAICSVFKTLAQPAGIIGDFTEVKPDLQKAKSLKFDYNSSDYTFREGICALQKNNLWGFIDTTGNWIIEPKYFQWGKSAPFFSDGICLLGLRSADGYGNTPVYINKKGEQLFKNQIFKEASPFSDGTAIVGKDTGPGKPVIYSYINTSGVALQGTVLPKFKGWFFEFGPFGNGLTKMWDDKLNSYGFVDNKGKWVIKPENKKWEEADVFADDRCAVQNTINFYWGYIDKNGATKVQFDYANKPNPFSSGRALVKNNSYQSGYLDKEGNMALDFKYTLNSFDFHNGYALVTLDNPELTKAIIDVDGNIIRKVNSETDPYVNPDGTIVIQPKGQDGLQVLNPDGSVILANALYLKILSFSDNRAYVEFYADNANQSGFINRKGELVIIRKD